MAPITINGVTFDPTNQGHVLAAAAIAPREPESNYVLVQTKAPLTSEEKQLLAGLSVEILEYVPENTYLCRAASADLAEIRALPFVTWADVYLRAFKVAPSLSPAPPEPSGVTFMRLAAAPDISLRRAPKTVDVVLHQGVDPESVREKIAAAAHLNPDDLTLDDHKTRITVQTRYLPDLAAIDEVRHLEEVIPRKLHNDIARKIIRAGGTGTTLPLEGTGEIVAVADTGFDKGSTTNVHVAFANRVLKLYPLGRTSANDPDGHGTHVAGSVLGDGTSTKLGVQIRGTAPKARLVLQSLLDTHGGLGGIPANLNNLFLPPYQNDHARVHSNSWGSVVGDGRYDSQASEVDQFVWNHRDFVICFAAGNAGKDSRGTGRVESKSVTAPGTAKNCITVGATENNRPQLTLTYGQGWPSDFPTAPLKSDRVANNPEGMAAFSSRGPTQDQRIKPDLVAPGTYILSTLSRDVIHPTGWGPSGDPLYFYEGGTSMATPLVAGCAAVVREHLIKERHIPTPSAALVKAMLINGAQDISGQYVPSEAGGIPNTAEGFGRVDLAATVGTAGTGTITIKDEATALDTNREEKMTITLAQQTSLLKVTLVWTDPPGETLQNDLDLIVHTADGKERHGNVDAGSTAFDRVNNVEQVVWKNPAAGKVDIIVRAHRISQFKQSYALVIRTMPK